MEKAAEFLRDIKPNDDVVVIFNNDGDGISSCSIMLKYLESKLKKTPYIISQPMPMDKNLIQRIKLSIPRKIIFLDLAVDQQENIINRVKGLADILIIDHHRIMKNLNSENVVHINPRFQKSDIYQSTSYLTYKICSLVDDMEKYLWMAAVGIVSDYDTSGSKDIVEEVKKKYNIKKDNLYDSIFGKITDMISAANATKEVSNEMLVDYMKKSQGPEDFISIQPLIKSYNDVEAEMDEIMRDVDSSAEIIGSFVFYNMKSKYNLRSPLSTKLSEKYPGKTVIIYQKIGSKVKLSSRNQSGKVDQNKLLKRAAKNLDASAGGHEKAAGAIVNQKDWETFRQRILS